MDPLLNETDDVSVLPDKEVAAAFFKLYQLHKKPVAVLIATSVDPSDVEDVLHDTIVAGLKSFHKMPGGPRKFSSWFFGVAKKVIAMYRRRKGIERRAMERCRETAKESFTETTIAEPISNETVMTQTHAPSESARRAHELLNTLPEQLRETLSLYFASNMSQEEIAEALGVHKNTVGNRLNQAKNLLALRARQMVVFGLLEIVNSDRLDLVAQKAFADYTGVPPEAATVAATTTAVGAVGAAKAASTFSLSGVLLFFGSFFAWIMSLLIGGRVYGTSIVNHAPSLVVRRWLVKHLLICYCGLMTVPTLPFLMYSFYLPGSTAITGFISVFRWVVVGGAGIYLYWLRKRYKQLISDQPTEADESRNQRQYAMLRRAVRIGFLGTTLVLLCCFGFYIAGTIPEIQDLIAAKKTSTVIALLIVESTLVIVTTLFHTGTFRLFQRYLSVSKDENVFRDSSVQFQEDTTARTWKPTDIAFVVSVLLTLIPSILHLILIRTRIAYATTELIVFGFLWYAVWQRNRQIPKNQGWRIQTMLTVQAIIFFLLREFLWI